MLVGNVYSMFNSVDTNGCSSNYWCRQAKMVIGLVYTANHHFSLFTLSVAIATVSVDTIEHGVYITNHHFSLFTLSVAIATVSVDTIERGVYIANHHF